MNENYKPDDHSAKSNTVLIELDGVEQLATLVYGGMIAGADLNVRDNDPGLLSQARAFARAVQQHCPAFCLSGEQIWNLMIVAANEAHTGNP